MIGSLAKGGWCAVRVLGEELVDRREDTVRSDPYVQEAAKIMETARNHLLAAVVAGDVAESRRLMEVFARAAFLKEETEDGLRVWLGLLTQDEVARRAAARRATMPGEALPARRRGLSVRRPRQASRPAGGEGVSGVWWVTATGR
jgi:hypothetical protein